MCKFIFDHEANYLSAFNSMWRAEVCHQHLAKGTLLIKNAHSLDAIEYFDFILILVAWRKRL
jgi:hypothetical protein